MLPSIRTCYGTLKSIEDIESLFSAINEDIGKARDFAKLNELWKILNYLSEYRKSEAYKTIFKGQIKEANAAIKKHGTQSYKLLMERVKRVKVTSVNPDKLKLF